jgi:polyvinyl alcohol dehydrogenase (cytochrome)
MDFSNSQRAKFIAFCILGLFASPSFAQAQLQEGEALYDANCASCHNNPADRAPSKLALSDYNPNAIFHALDVGIMQTQAAALSVDQKILVAEYLTAENYRRDRIERFTACSTGIAELDLGAASNWNGWGNDLGGQRYQSALGTAISKENIADLEVAWSLGVEGSSAARAQPAIIDGVIYMGSPSGQVYALDLASGCHYWTYAAIAEVRAAPTVVDVPELNKTLVIVADQSNRVYALDAQTGLKLWHADPDQNPWAVSTGAPVVHGNRVFVPVSSMEVAGAGNPQHVCCTFRGNVAALDLLSGEMLWHTFIMEEAREVGKNSVGNAILAPSGAPIWGSASFDVKRNRVYVGSGQNYTRPTSDSSDAVIAFDASNGNIDWLYQSTANDAFTMGCAASIPIVQARYPI